MMGAQIRAGLFTDQQASFRRRDVRTDDEVRRLPESQRFCR
jgi:hypothetical protein